DLQQKVQDQEKDRTRFIEEVKKVLAHELNQAGLTQFVLQGRSKHLWSIYRKMKTRNLEFSQIYDILAFRVIVENVSQCYSVLGLVHSIWKPIPGRFKDFIAMPKANGYQSLHTTVIGPNGQRIEIQIRTHEMHQVAERGIAAHWRYKEQGFGVDPLSAQRFDWLRSLLEWQRSVKNSEEFLDSVKTDLFESEIYVFTPKGDVKEFPEGASIIDFAYAIHTDVGNKCVGAKVNGKMVPIRYILQNGDTVEVITSPTQKPSKDWLKLAVTNRAKSKIRNFVREEQRQQALLLGKELVEREFRKFGATASRYLGKEDDPNLQKMMSDLGLHRIDDIYIRVGYGRLEPKTLLERLAPDLTKNASAKNQEEKKPGFIRRFFEGNKIRKSQSLIRVSGMDDMLVHFARCCHPIPGDNIVGFITRGRGITIHRADCPKAFQFDAERRIDVEWNVDGSKAIERVVKIQVVSQDSKGLLKQIAEAFAANQMNIEGAQIHTTKDAKAISVFTASVANTAQVSQLIQAIQKIKGIIEVKRVIG
ncbi:MAG: RelA/SpoT family protein, partial [Bdellovibrionaceae bacterium]|nr:RelA/SpoT family protein [Pseudobdellovibrionaceae bacterium]MDW8191207.1 RelA/SpoT family protein [Pseudobdellovibrionaceae bacterium]